MLDEIEQRIVNDIAEFGWHVLNIQHGEEDPRFSYTIGIMQTLEGSVDFHPDWDYKADRLRDLKRIPAGDYVNLKTLKSCRPRRVKNK